MKTADENREAAFAAAAMIVPAVEAGVGRNWLPVLIVGLASELLYCIQREPKGELPGWMSMLRVATMLFLASWLMGRIAEPWPGRAADLCMKCSLGISNFLKEIFSLSHSVVFLYFFALIAEECFLI